MNKPFTKIFRRTKLYEVSSDGSQVGVLGMFSEKPVWLPLADISTVLGEVTGIRKSSRAWNPRLHFITKNEEHYFLPIGRTQKAHQSVTSLLQQLSGQVQIDTNVQKYLEARGVHTSNITFSRVPDASPFVTRGEVQRGVLRQAALLFVALGIILGLAYFAYLHPDRWIAQIFARIAETQG